MVVATNEMEVFAANSTFLRYALVTKIMLMTTTTITEIENCYAYTTVNQTDEVHLMKQVQTEYLCTQVNEMQTKDTA